MTLLNENKAHDYDFRHIKTMFYWNPKTLYELQGWCLVSSFENHKDLVRPTEYKGRQVSRGVSKLLDPVFRTRIYDKASPLLCVGSIYWRV